MRISLALFLLLFALPCYAADEEAMHAHGSTLFHRFTLESDVGSSREGTRTSWDLDGWVGGDTHKLAIKSEGEKVDGITHQAEFWAMYSRNVATFWDAQIGIRHDIQPHATEYLTLGTEGLAPYFFETQAHLFISDAGDVSARLRQENELLFTQALVLQPYAELNLFLQDVADQDSGAGLSTGEIGLQLRYEFTRKFAPYLDLRYEKSFGETASMARSNGDPTDDTSLSAGIRLMF